MDESNHRNKRPHPLVMLVAGSALSGVPLLISIGIQHRTQDKPSDRLRQLDFIHSYVKTCTQFNNDKRRLLDALNRSIVYDSDNQSVIDQIAGEARGHGSEYRLQIAILNLVFGEHIEPVSTPSLSLPSVSGDTKEGILETWRKALADRKSEIEREEQGCEESAKRLLEAVGTHTIGGQQ